MRNKIIYLTIFLILSLFLIKIDVNAQFLTIPVPGKDCGVPGDIRTNKCCVPTKTSFVQPPNFGSGIFNTLISIILQPGMALFNSYMKPITDLYVKATPPCLGGSPSTADVIDPSCQCIDNALPITPAINRLGEFCNKMTGSNEQNRCNNCITSGGVWTGIGCVQGNLNKFITETIFGWGIGLAGGFALLCIIYAAFIMQSSQGNPEKLKKAQELITSCIMGLMLIIFSVFILRLIGVDILKIPGFT